MAKKKQPIKSPTGCRPAQLFGVWMIEADWFRKVYAQAMRIDLVALGEARLVARRMEAATNIIVRADSPSAPLPSERPDIKKKSYQVDNGVATFSISGPMSKYETSYQEIFGGTATIPLRNSIREAMDDDNVLCAMITIDSPGGTCDGTMELANDIAAFSAVKPCMAYIDGLGCSAAYWCASQATMIYATPTSLVGSIGTRLRLEDTTGMYEQNGVKVHEITTGPMKAAGADGTPITDDQIAYYQKIADDLQQFFAAAVTKGRAMSDQQMQAVSDGRVFVAEEAMGMRLVDAVSTYEGAMTALKNKTYFGQRQV